MPSIDIDSSSYGADLGIHAMNTDFDWAAIAHIFNDTDAGPISVMLRLVDGEPSLTTSRDYAATAIEITQTTTAVRVYGKSRGKGK